MRRITAAQRRQLKKPLGKLCSRAERIGGKLVTVGDAVSFQFLEEGRVPDLMIYDNYEMRRKVSDKVKAAIKGADVHTLRLSNPAGTIQEGAWDAIKEGLSRPSKIEVDGEEDLLVLPVIALCDAGTTVCYGQPGEGIVMIRVDEAVKKKVGKIIGEMEVLE
jgi:hypothetical protein